MSIAGRIGQILTAVHHAELHYDRTPSSVRILAVSKGHSPIQIQQAYAEGLRAFGENYVQEALQKIQRLSSLDIEWHFIGSLQSNKVKLIANQVSWVQSVSRFKIAHLLNEVRDPQSAPLNICLQVNIDGDQNKSGILPEEVIPLAKSVMALPRLTLRGLMTIPDPAHTEASLLHTFKQLHTLRDKVSHALNWKLDTLSMGMSDDWKTAIQAGSTMLRLGRSIFGARG